MSDNKKAAEQNEQKVMTKYDLKMQKRKEQKEREKKEQFRGKVIGIAVLVALVCVIAYFPIRSYQVINNAYVTIGGKEVTQLEFDYRYNVTVNNYTSQYGSYMSYFGVDFTKDLSKQMYTENMSWRDLFEEMTVESMKQRAGMLEQIEATGFTYDTTENYELLVESMKEVAAELGLSMKNYVKQLYGSYATLDRIADYMKEDLVVTAFYNQVAEEKAPTEEDIQAHYEAYKDSYDSVDYRVTTIEAELPTETEPTAEEIEKAMADAKVLAEEALATVAVEGEQKVNLTIADVETILCDWLYDPARKAGDTTVVEDTANNLYYTLAFEQRYLDNNATADVRMLLSEDKTGQEILDEWKSGEATEESFTEICNQYAIEGITQTGGLYEGVVRTDVPEEIATWLFDEERTEGDTTTMVTDEGYHYVVYFISQDEPVWKQSAGDTLLTENMNAYVDEISADITVEDPKGNLNYLKVQAQEEAAAESTPAE